MGGGSKGGGSGSFNIYDYYGTIFGMLRAGPVDTLRMMLVNGEIVWQGPIHRTDPGVGNPYTLTLTDPKWTAPGGYVRLYWGDDTQTVVDPAVANHPPMRGMAYMVFCNFLFGRESTTVPNIEVIADAIPRPPNTVIAATDLDVGANTASGNVWAILAEILTSIHGANIDPSKLDPVSWQAIHDYFASSTDLRLLAYCAPLLTNQQQLSGLCNDLLSLVDGGLRAKGDGTIEAFYYPVDPGDLSQYTILTANDLTAPPDITFEAWDAVPTGAQANFVDGDQWFVQWALKADDLRALQQAVEPRRTVLQLPFVIRHAQALRVAAEWCKRKCQPQISGTISVRAERAVNPDGSPLRVGNRFQLDIDPEPGGGALLQLCRVVNRKFSATGPVTIDFAGEVLQPAVPYTPIYTPPGNEEGNVAALVAAQVLPLPLGVTGTASVGLLARRGDDLTIGAHLLFDVAGGAGTFRSIGDQIGFAVQSEFAADYSDTATGVIEVTLLDTRDEAIALTQPGDNGAQNDELLLVAVRTDGGGYIEEHFDGTPAIEYFSVSSSALVSGNTYNFTCYRSRLGTTPIAWSAGETIWIIPRASLTAFVHQTFPSYVNSNAAMVFRGSPFSRFAEYTGVPANLPFKFPTAWQRAPRIAWTTPAGNSTALGSDGNLTPVATITDYDNNLISVELYNVRQDTGIETVHFNVRFAPSGSKTLAQCFALANVATPLNFAGQVAADTYYTLTIRATDASRNVIESRRNLVRLATGGGSPGMVPPSIDPPGPDFSTTLNVTVTGAAPATELQYATTSYGGDLPGAGSWVTVMALTQNFIMTGSKRLWARAGDGVNWSGWVFQDYRQTYGGGGQLP